MFEFQTVVAGTTASTPPAVVTTKVKECRGRGGPWVPPTLVGLCSCASPLLHVSKQARDDCYRAIRAACTHQTGTMTTSGEGLGPSESTGSNVGASVGVGAAASPPSVKVLTSSGDGRCDDGPRGNGVCASGLPDATIADTRPNSAAWRRANQSVALPFQRLCLACDDVQADNGVAEADSLEGEAARSFKGLSAPCWSEWRSALRAYGVDAADLRPGGRARCERVARARRSYESTNCDADEGFDGEDVAMGSRDPPLRGGTGRWYGQR